METQELVVPIRLIRGNSKYYLNLNHYNKWHYRLSNTLKKQFKQEVKDSVESLRVISTPCEIHYTIFYPTAALFDLDNIGSVVSKFTNDAIVELGRLEDDSHKYISKVSYSYGGKDKDNPRCEILIKEV